MDAMGIFILSAILSGSLVISTVSASYSHSGCPNGLDWYHFNDMCYSLSEDAEGWFGSEKACQKLGGHLATIANKEENQFLQALGQCHQSAWIGMVKTDVTNRQFAWWNDAAFNYTDPLSINTNSYADCVYQSGSNYARWYNTYCQSLYRYICMVPPREGAIDNSIKSDESTSQKKCPEGWLHIEGKCFYVSSRRTNYFNAQITCESMGATVATVKSRREQHQLTIAIGCETRAWIGLEKVRPCLSDPSQSYCYMWMDGSADEYYSEWAPGHPSSSNEIECTYTQGRWYTTNCYNEYNFVCMKK